MEDQITEVIELADRLPGQFREQLERMREFRDRMQISEVAPRQEQFAVRKVTPLEPRRSIAIHR